MLQKETIYALKINNFYKVNNPQSQDLEVMVVNGNVQINGECFDEKFIIKAQSSMVVKVESIKKLNKIEEYFKEISSEEVT